MVPLARWCCDCHAQLAGIAKNMQGSLRVQGWPPMVLLPVPAEAPLADPLTPAALPAPLPPPLITSVVGALPAVVLPLVVLPLSVGALPLPTALPPEGALPPEVTGVVKLVPPVMAQTPCTTVKHMFHRVRSHRFC
jgi:hypothetical protein